MDIPKKMLSLQKRNPEKFDIIELYNAIGRENKFTLKNKSDEEIFVEKIKKSLSVFMTDTMIYGKRTESMFAYMVASLGNCILIKKEDCGDIFCEDNIIIPDYRLVLRDKRQILVEVKNVFQKSTSPSKDYSINLKQFNGLLNYAKIMNVEVMFAIYWTKWNLWTLNTQKDFNLKKQKMVLSLKNAVESNQLVILGDSLIATNPPLAIRIYTNKNLPHRIINNESIFTIGAVEFYSNNKMITDTNEKNIAFSLILYGDWRETVDVITTTSSSDELDYIEFSYSPEETDESQGFSMIGTISGIISRQYNDLTGLNGKVKSISPVVSPNILGVVIPISYKGKSLHLWRFSIYPKDKEENK